jgi:NADPH:quinone reductase-like Zn-dependent oxidoreductase
MKAIVYRRYGSPDVLRLQEVDKPSPKSGEVLVRVHAAAVNPLDWHLLRGQPYIVRPTSGWLKPKRNIPGVDVAGVVEAVGTDVTDLTPSDEVFGEKTRACAEYVCGPEKLFVRKPVNLSLEQAAAIPVGAVTALQALREHGHIQAGQKVLINGASGGVGTFAVQLAKHFGAEVTGVCSTPNVDLVRSLGADHVIDYTHEDFTTGSDRYDLILDIAGMAALAPLRRALTPTGTLVHVGGEEGGDWTGGTIGRQLRARTMSLFVRQRLSSCIAKERGSDVERLTELIESGRVTPSIDRTYPLTEAPAAMRHLEAGLVRGKISITTGMSR